MKQKKVLMQPNRITPSKPVIFNKETCTGCNRCVDVCMLDVLYPNPEKGNPPIVLYPDECWHCGICMEECPVAEKNAVNVIWPIMTRMRWKRKETGETFRLGMSNPPPPNTRPPVGGWDPGA